MNEFEDKINPIDEANEFDASGDGKAPTSLEEELESLKDMFQAELDSAMAESENETEADEADEEAEETEEAEEAEEIEPEIDPEDLCQCCEEKLRDKSLGEDYPYCAECRELMRRYPLGVKGIISLIAVIALIITSVFYVFPRHVETLSACLTADEYLAEGKLYSGLYAYYDAISAADSKMLPKKAIARCAKAFANLNDYMDATTIAQQYLSESDLKLPSYRFLNEYSLKSDTLVAVENAVYDSLSSEDTTADDADEVIALIDALAEQEDKEYDTYYLEYYKYVVMHTLKVDVEEQIAKLVEIDEAYGDKEWVHCYDLCNLYSIQGNVEKTEEYFNKIIAQNTEDGAAYAYYANVYRFTETPDPDKMLEITQKGLEAQGSYSYATSDLYRIQALAYLLNDDMDAAMECATKMYSAIEGNNYAVTNLFQGLYTYALCALASGDDEAYANVETLLKYNNYKVPQSVIDATNHVQAMVDLIIDREGVLA